VTREFSRHNRGDFTPACCTRCQRTDDIIDLGAEDIHGYGRIYLCVLCLAELAQGMGYVDETTHNGMQRALAAESAHWKTAYAQERDSAAAQPQKIRELTERLGNGIRELADDFARSIFSRTVGDGGDAVPTQPPSNEGGERGAVGVPDEDRGDERAGGAELAGSDRVDAGSEPEDPERDDVDGDLGAGPAANSGAEVDGSNVDPFFGWLELGTDEDGDPAAERDEPPVD